MKSKNSRLDAIKIIISSKVEPVITTYYPITPLTPNGLSTSTLTIIKLG